MNRTNDRQVRAGDGRVQGGRSVEWKGINRRLQEMVLCCLQKLLSVRCVLRCCLVQ